MTPRLENRETARAEFAYAAMPFIFVFLWSSGYIAAKLALPHAGPLTLVAFRFLATAVILLPVVILWRAPWPASWRDVGHIAVTGILVNCVTLTAGPYAMWLGASTGLTALIQGLQPMLTAVVAGPALGEKISRQQWLGLLLGFAGLIMVLSDKISMTGVPALAIVLAVISLFSMTIATLYQKRFCANIPLRSGAAIQFVAASLISVPIATTFEGLEADWTPELVLGIAWLVFGLSLGALTVFWVLVRRGAAAKVTSLFYLTPPLTAVMGWLAFDERLGVPALIGMVVVTLGVLLATRPGTQPGG